MKKIFLLIILSTMLLLSGCMGFNIDYVPNSVISESLISKMQSNMDTNTLEGFTCDSTFGDVLDKIAVKEISQARLFYNSELLGYPVVSEYIFDNFGGYDLSLNWMTFAVMPDSKKDSDAQINDIVTIMDAQLGSHDRSGDEYSWDQNNCSINFIVYDRYTQSSGEIALIEVYPNVVALGIYPKCPDLFPYPFGTDIQTVYQRETPNMLPKGFENSASINYEEDGIKISLQFITDDTGNFRLSEGAYDVYLNNMSFKNSVDYFETLSDGFVAAAGEPEARGYGIPEVFGDFFESGYTYEDLSGAQGMSAQEILDSGGDDYWLDIRWEGICFCAAYVTDANISINFFEEYIDGTGKE